MADKLRYGVIGIGNMGTAHIKLYSEGKIKEMVLTAVCDIVPERLEAALKLAPGTKGFKKHAGKVLFFTALGSTVFGVANTIIRARNMSKNLCDPDVIDRSKDSMAV